MGSAFVYVLTLMILLTCLSFVKCSNEEIKEEFAETDSFKRGHKVDANSHSHHDLKSDEKEDQTQLHPTQLSSNENTENGDNMVNSKENIFQNQMTDEIHNEDLLENHRVNLETVKENDNALDWTKDDAARGENSESNNEESDDTSIQRASDVEDDKNNNGHPVSREEVSDTVTQSVETNDPENVKVGAPEVDEKKQRYFPLLYTFGSLFSSFLAEFGEDSTSSDSSLLASNSSSDSNPTNSSVFDGIVVNGNSSSNGTDQGKKNRFQCLLNSKQISETLNLTSEVQIINSTQLLEILNFSRSQKTSQSPCVLVMFYTKWCPFSAKAAPQYNALARAFPQLDVLAVDTSHFSYLNAKFGTVAVPNIMLFHSRSAVRFNHTTRDLENFVHFVTNNTGIEPAPLVTVSPEDFEGPLSSRVEQGRDWLLWLAWAFIIVCSTYGFFFSLYGQAVIGRLRVLWQEHQHIE